MVCIATALSLKLQIENAGTYVYFVFILQKSLQNLYLLADFQNLKFYR